MIEVQTYEKLVVKAIEWCEIMECEDCPAPETRTTMEKYCEHLPCQANLVRHLGGDLYI